MDDSNPLARNMRPNAREKLSSSSTTATQSLVWIIRIESAWNSEARLAWTAKGDYWPLVHYWAGKRQLSVSQESAMPNTLHQSPSLSTDYRLPITGYRTRRHSRFLRQPHQLGNGLHLKLGHDVGTMSFDGAFARAEIVGSLLVQLSAQDMIE